MRRWMIELRERMGLDMHAMAKKCGCSVTLLEYLEMGDSQTLPTLARQIGIAYGMTLVQANELAKPLQPKYLMIGGKGGTTFAWCPPKEETVPIIAAPKKVEKMEPPEIYFTVSSLLKATGKSARQLSIEAGRAGSYVGNLLLAMANGRVMGPDTRKKLALILGCDEETLKGSEMHEWAIPAMS